MRFFFFPRFLIEFVEFKGKRFKDRAVFFMKSIPLVSCREQNINFLAIATDQFHRSFRSICRRIVSIFFFSYYTSMNPIVFLERKRERERQREKMIRWRILLRYKDCVTCLNLFPPIDSRYSDLCFHFKLALKTCFITLVSLLNENLESKSNFDFFLFV